MKKERTFSLYLLQRRIDASLSILMPSSSGILIAVDPYGRDVARVNYFHSVGSSLMAVLPVGSVDTVADWESANGEAGAS